MPAPGDNGRHLGVASLAIATAEMAVLAATIVNVALADRGFGRYASGTGPASPGP